MLLGGDSDSRYTPPLPEAPPERTLLLRLRDQSRWTGAEGQRVEKRGSHTACDGDLAGREAAALLTLACSHYPKEVLWALADEHRTGRELTVRKPPLVGPARAACIRGNEGGPAG